MTIKDFAHRYISLFSFRTETTLAINHTTITKIVHQFIKIQLRENVVDERKTQPLTKF